MQKRKSKTTVILEALVPLYGYGARFRLYLRLREFYRVHNLKFLAQCLKGYLLYKYGCELSINAKISPSAKFMHTVGVVIGEGVTVEAGVVIYSGVCLGRKDITNKNDYPWIKSGVLLCTDCSVLGNVTVGENAIVGAKSLVISDCKSGGFYAGIPAILKTEDNR